MIDLRSFVDQAEALVAQCRLDTPGRYRRHAAEAQGELNPYGCADAANILYTIGRFPREPQERAGWVAVLQSMQDPATGLYHEDTHHPIHTTAHCLAALELFDALPLHRLSGLLDLGPPGPFLDGLNWAGDPWRASHQGAGIYAALAVADALPPGWAAAYFGWLWDEADPDTGLWRRGRTGAVTHTGVTSRMPHLAGTFHYLFNQEYAHQPLHYPQRLVDTCLEIRAEGVYPLARRVGFAEIDWVYCLNRALRQSHHRAAECRAALTAFAQDYTGFLLGLDPVTDPGLGDLHQLFGVLCALAELQQALPGLLVTERPLRLVLDRRPFI